MMLLGMSLLFAAIGSPATNRAWAMFLGSFLAAVGIGLLILSWTRWGQSKLLSKCIAIALLAHIWLLLYAYGTRIPFGTQGSGNGSHDASLTGQPQAGPVMVAWTPLDLAPDPPSLQADQQGETGASETESSNTGSSNTGSLENGALGATALWNRSIELPGDWMHELDWADREVPELPTPEELLLWGQIQETTTDIEEPSDLPVDPLLDVAKPSPLASAPVVPIENPARAEARSLDRVPEVYRLRFAPDRLAHVMQSGGDANTEQAVGNALAFLARAQSPDGSWNAEGYGAGQARYTVAAADSVYRADTGKHADTAMTGLALLAFLGAGHTHKDPGAYCSTVQRGLDYLCQQQFPSGDLSGYRQIGNQPTVRYSRMYSHGIAGMALAEAFAMTQDPKLLEPIGDAVGYTLKAMNPKTGGWRYDFSSEDPGDTSQFGWQAMLLSSASTSRARDLSGSHRVLLQRFLDSVSTGKAGGLAVYRNLTPLSRPSAQQATAAMTAEAFAMRMMLGLPMSAQATQEAQQMILGHLPGSSEKNFYFWYYATLALHQTSSNRKVWDRWNEALKRELVSTQVQAGEFAGSWDPLCVWGGHGGRIYTTALGCMCLEVYYRYLPIYHL